MNQRVLRWVPVLLVGVLPYVASACSDRGSVVAVDAPAIIGIAYLDEGEVGPSPGDRYVFTSDGVDDAGKPVRSNWELTTIAVSDDTEIRRAEAVFEFSDGSQLILAGTAQYPLGGGTLRAGEVVERPLTGGSGRFAGARGYTRSVHRPDDTWRWEFHLS